MKHLRLFSVIMVLALCFGVAQGVDAKKKKQRNTHKKEKFQSLKRVEECNRVIGAVDEDCGGGEILTPKSDDEEVFKSSAYMPKFLGGDYAMMRFINNNIRYPQTAADNHIEGKVIVQFVVEKDGSIGEVKVARGVHEDIDQEAVRVIKMLPKFYEPGRNAIGEPVRVWYTMPINFKLQCAVEAGPTGDYAYDAKQVGEEVIKILMRDINSEDDINQMEKDTEALQKKYEDFYKARGGEKEWKKFNEELEKLGTDPVFSKRFEGAKKSLEDKAHKLFE
ncbi:MAG: energy transducer TonB [Muribaculaceae bacterium]|nr:energy transducer TonB [Muribaculaceae bacterium]MBR5117718.1 energy transducer TonB [Muribaculaceae bacterium]MBR5171425.1 energy transducer TonB [Muribaculaceae bacterium]